MRSATAMRWPAQLPPPLLLGAASATNDPLLHALLPSSEHVPPCDPGACVFGCSGQCALRCVDYIDYRLAKEGDVAAVIVETIRCTDVQVPPHEYYRRLREICGRHGALLILDEIPIALGRTGHLFAIERYGITPDMLVIGKGLGGGTMPLAALIARARFDVGQHISLGHYTHEKNPVACAAGLAVLDVIEQEDLLARSRRLGEAARLRLEALAGEGEAMALHQCGKTPPASPSSKH